jgi:Domain of unknown function (DUF1772)
MEGQLRTWIRHAGEPRPHIGWAWSAGRWQAQDWRWIVGAALILANWRPYTLIGIMPTNNRLKAIAEADAAPISRGLIERWGRLHAGRTVLGIAATVAYVWAIN